MSMVSISVMSGFVVCYRPQRSCKVMFSQASVILFTGRGVYPSMHWGRHPPGRHAPGQTPLRPTATAADGTHPTGMHAYLIRK